MDKSKNNETTHRRKKEILNVATIILFLVAATLVMLQFQEKYKVKRDSYVAQVRASSPQILRQLGNFTESTNKICDRGTPELREYYKTGDTSKYDTSSIGFNTSKPAAHIQAIIDLIGGTGDQMTNIITYGKHIIIPVFFLVLGILMIFLWIVCWLCCCCNCCCCCCCKKRTCKFVCFGMAIGMYTAIAACCLYGITQSNKLFNGIGDVECSIMKFIHSILEGEDKEIKPKWVGANNFGSILDTLTDSIEEIKGDTHTNMTINYNNYLAAKSNIYNYLGLTDEAGTTHSRSWKDPEDSFKFQIETTGNYFTLFQASKNGNMVPITTSASEILLNFNYSGYINYFQEQFVKTKDFADDSLKESNDNFDTVMTDPSLTKTIDDAKSQIDDVANQIKGQADSIAEKVESYSDLIDSYGKMAFKFAFIGILAVNILSAATIVLYMLFSCSTCLSCFIKIFIHVCWNLFALLSIVAFILGGLFTILGTIGKDAIDLISHVASKGNLEAEEPDIIGSAGGNIIQYLNVCLHGDGNLKDVLNFGDGGMDSLSELRTIQSNLSDSIEKIDNELAQSVSRQAINNLRTKICQKGIDGNYPDNVYFQDTTDKTKNQKYQNIKSDSSKKGDADGFLQKICTEDEAKSDSSDSNHLVGGVYSNGTNCDQGDRGLFCFYIEGDNLFTKLADTEKNSVNIFIKAIDILMEAFNEALGSDNSEGGIYGFVNCKFLGDNLKNILQTLKSAFGKYLYGSGIALLLAGSSMAFSIAVTLVAISIIKKIAEEDKEAKEKGGEKKSKGPHKYKPRHSKGAMCNNMVAGSNENIGLKENR